MHNHSPYREARRSRASILALFALLTTVFAATAAGAATVRGTVTDRLGAGVAGVKVSLAEPGGAERTTWTDAIGAYRLDGVPEGTPLRLRFERDGMPAVERETNVAAGGTAVEDARLEILVAESITVTGEAETSYRPLVNFAGAKIDIPLLDVPQSVQVVPLEVIEDQRPARVTDALRNVSGVVPEAGFGGTLDGVYIRGFQATTVMKNGFRQQRTGGLTGLANVERLEVLKGPASVLWGNAAPGGVINIVTKQPLAERHHDAEVSIGSFAQRRAQVDLTGPLGRLSDHPLLFRLTGSFEKADGFRDDFETESTLVAPVLHWNASDTTTLRLEGEYYDHSRPNLTTGGFFFGGRLLELPIETNLSPSWTENDAERRQVSLALDRRLGSDWSLRGQMRYLDTESSRSFTFGSLAEDGRTFERSLVVDPEETTDDHYAQVDVLGSIETGAIGHRLLFGVEVGRDRFLLDEIFTGFTPIDIFTPRRHEPRPDLSGETPYTLDLENDYRAVYAQDQIILTPELKVLAGVRFDRIDAVDRSFGQDPAEGRDEATSPRLGVVYQPRPYLSLFAGYSRSFSPIGIVNLLGERLKPERGTQVEVGVKTDLLFGKLSSTLSWFDLKRSDISTRDAANPALFIQIGEQRTRGVELDVAGSLSDAWKVIASFAYTPDAEVTEDRRLPVGARLDNVPRRTASLWTTYDLPETALGRFSLGGGAFHVGRRPGELSLTPFELPSYTLLDAVLAYQRGFLRITLHGQNLTDERYFEASQGPSTLFYGSPRTWGLTVGVEL